MEHKAQPPQTHQQQHKQNSPKHQNISPTSKTNNNNKNNLTSNKKQIWDCGSTLYDSFELNSFQKQLDSAIITSSRTFSMPRNLPSDDYHAPPHSKKPESSKLSRTFQKLLRSVFKAHKPNHQPKPNYDNNISTSPDPWFMDPLDDHNIQEKDDKVVDNGRYFVVYEKPNGLSTIPEVPEVGFSPDIRSSLVRKTMSDRFSVASNGIFCV